MNLFIVSVRSHDFWCYQNRNLVSNCCVLYADDIVLLSASLSVLQNIGYLHSTAKNCPLLTSVHHFVSLLAYFLHNFP